MMYVLAEFAFLSFFVSLGDGFYCTDFTIYKLAARFAHTL